MEEVAGAGRFSSGASLSLLYQQPQHIIAFTKHTQHLIKRYAITHFAPGSEHNESCMYGTYRERAGTRTPASHVRAQLPNGNPVPLLEVVGLSSGYPSNLVSILSLSIKSIIKKYIR